MDYYFKITVVVLILLCMVISFVKTVFFNRMETMLSVMVVNDTIDFDSETMGEALCQSMGWTGKKQEVTCIPMSTGSYETDMALVVRLQAASVDVMIADEETFERYMKNGFFDEVEAYIPEGLDLTDSLVRGCIETLDDTGAVIDRGEELAYGIDLSGSETYRELGGILEDPVMGIVVNGEHHDAGGAVVAYLMK